MLTSPAMTGFPKSRRVKLKYVDEIGFASSALMQNYNYVANSVFDPNNTATGHQPMFYDQWSAVYTHYTVLASKITVTPIHASTTDVNPAYVGINLSTHSNALSTDFTSVNSLLENPYTTPPILCGNYNKSTAVGQNSLTAVDCKFKANSFFGVKDVRDGSAYSADTSSNPSQLAFYRIYAAPVVGNTYGTVNLLVEVIYDVLFKDPRTVDGS